MSVKLIAVDMDSTFLKSDKTYNKARFLDQYAQLKQRGIHFVAASGNPLYTLKNYFPDIADEISYVAENGVYVMQGNTELNYAAFDAALLKQMLGDLNQDFAECLILCAKQCGYIGTAMPEQNLNKIKVYFKQLQQVADLTQIDDQICKITLNTHPDAEQQALALLKTKPYVEQQQVNVVSSGFGFIDLILPNQHKAYGLAFLQQHWGIADQHVLAIGDNYNDLQMVQKAGYGFAMANAVPALKQVARFHAKSNNEEGVLDVIDWVLEGQGQWPLTEKEH
ncbi:hypothetical protein EC844_1145 [Acinetobacter calcoaceticus]|uniref:Hydrolase n=1 Tax=Acinetobacter calcoaceticus TaxID=471 RepID=A0A4V2R0S3_ACICA|nr:hypothetical protein EC844_1145 [Acinetobacter calcoaceticus]